MKPFRKVMRNRWAGIAVYDPEQAPRVRATAWAGPLDVRLMNQDWVLPTGSAWQFQMRRVVVELGKPEWAGMARRCWQQWAKGRCPQCRAPLAFRLTGDPRAWHKMDCSESWRSGRKAAHPWYPYQER